MQSSRHWSGFLALAFLTLPGVTLAQTRLDDGFPAEGLAGAQNSNVAYYLDVPAGTTNLGFRLTQGTGGAVMTVNFGAPHSTAGGTAECVDDETCEFTDPTPGRWYVELFGVTAYSGAALRGWSLTHLSKGDVAAGLAGEADTYRWFYLTLPGGVDSLTATTSGGTGDVSLVVVSAVAWDAILNGTGGTFCQSEDTGNAETCTRSKPQSGTWLVFLYGEAAYTGVTLDVDYEQGSGGALSPMSLGGLALLGLASLLRRRGIALVLLLLGASAASAADTPPKIADFARHPDFQRAVLSPNGQFLATTRTVNGRKVLQILRLKDRQPIGAFQLAGDRDIEDLYWPNDEHVLFGTSLRLGSLGHVTLTNDLMQVKIDGTSPETFIKRADDDFFDTRDFDIVDLLRDDPDNVLITLFDDRSNYKLGNLYRWNMRTGMRTKVMQTHLLWGGLYSDERQGTVRVQNGSTKDGDSVLMARASEKDSWQEISRAPLAGFRAIFVGFSANPNQIYIRDGVDGGVDGLYTLDLTTKARNLLHSSPEFTLSGLLYGRDLANPIGVEWEGERNQWKFFDDKHPDAVLFQSLRKALGDVDLSFSSFSKDRTLAVVSAYSDTMPTSYFVVDLVKPGLLARLQARPWIDPAQMSPKLPIQFKARDGMNIHGYLTLPRSRGTGPLPMVVIPHGGPHGERDYWGFNSEVQLLASRGYAVLQPNYRGSGGYGANFEKAGHGQWGKAMQDDLIDATRWAIQQGHADAGRICIYGASYGAYAALEAVSGEPDMYRCAVGYAGVYDLRASIDEAYGATTRDYWKKVIGGDMKDLDSRSPALHASRIKVPVFLAHGEDDQTCPISQFKKMRKALVDNNKTVEELVKDGEGHGFYEEKNVEEFYTRLLAFLDTHTAPKPR